MTDGDRWDVYLTYASDDDDIPSGWEVCPMGERPTPEISCHFLCRVEGRQPAMDRAREVFESTVKMLKGEREKGEQ